VILYNICHVFVAVEELIILSKYSTLILNTYFLNI